MTRLIAAATTLAALSTVAFAASNQPNASDAQRIHERAIVVDTHDDTTLRLIHDKAFDIGRRNDSGSVDIPRMREGGLDALFFSIYLPGDVTGPVAVKQALQQIDSVREAVRAHPKHLMLATSVADIRRAAADRKIAALMGMEGGHMLDEDLGVLRMYAALGVRYLTLTHSLNVTWADSSGDKPVHNGLTAFGKDVVRELNRLGLMVDVSHVADKTFYDVMETSKAPVIASHSSCRAIANHPRNMTDDMLRTLAKNGGVVMINYHSTFVSEEFRAAPKNEAVELRTAAMKKDCAGNAACEINGRTRIAYEAMRAGELPTVTWEKVIEHIEHAIKVAGVDHVGLGSDFDGAIMPIGLEDASKLPRITAELLRRGYSGKDVAKILGGNLLRVMGQVEAARER